MLIISAVKEKLEIVIGAAEPRVGEGFFAAAGGKMRLNHLKNTEPNGTSRAKSSVFLFIYGLIQMFEYFILVYFLSHKLADSIKDDFKRFVKGNLNFLAI